MPLSALERYRRPGILALAPDALTEPDDGTDPAFNPNAANATTPPAPKPPSSAPTSAALDQPTPLNGKPALTPGGASGTKGLAIMPPPGQQIPSQETADAAASANPEPPPAAPAPPEVPGSAPRPGIANAPPSPLDQKLQKESADIQEQRATLKRPDNPNSNWAQRLGSAVLSMTKFAPVANQIVHPKWSAQEANYERSLGDLDKREKQVNSQETTGAQAAYKEAMAQQAALTGEARLASATTRAQAEQDRAKEAADKIAQLKSTAYQNSIKERLKGREMDTVYQQADAPRPEGSEYIENKEEPGMGWVAPPAWHQTPAELVPFAPGYKAGDQMPHSQFVRATAEYDKDKLAATTAAGKPKTAEQVKLEFQGLMQKLAAEPGLLNARAVTDVGQVFKAIEASKTLLPEEKNLAKAYITANPTPQATGSNVSARDLAQELSRIFPAINKTTGELGFVSSKGVNDNPDTYMPAAPGAKALSQQALFSEIHYNIDTARKAIQSLDGIDAKTRASLAYVLRHTDPESAAKTWLTGEAATTLTDQQQEAVQALAQLSENALSMRQVAGMGAGAADVRAAIQAVLPSPKSPTTGYMLGQLGKFETVVNRLEHAVPKTNGPARPGSAPAQQPGPGRGGAPAGGGPAPNVPPQTATMQDVRDYAIEHKMTNDDAKAAFVKDGIVIK